MPKYRMSPTDEVNKLKDAMICAAKADRLLELAAQLELEQGRFGEKRGPCDVMLDDALRLERWGGQYLGLLCED